MLGESRPWVMPGPDPAGTICFYEDFPYAWWTDFHGIDDLAGDPFARLPGDVSLFPEYADITDDLERKISGITLYQSQIERLFDSDTDMADAVRTHARAIAGIGGVDGSAERYWVSSRV
jgi:hypothetical protein